MVATADLTSAARIRAAALEGFATRGVEATSIRAVAAAAGVSPGLVQHHYPSKDALRAAVHEHVLAVAAESLSDLPRDAQASEFADEVGRRITNVFRDSPLAFRYIARGIADGDPVVLELFDALVAMTGVVADEDIRDGRMRPDVDPIWARLHVLVYNLGVVLLEEAINRHLPDPLRTEVGLERWRQSATSMFRQGLYVPDP
jgi:AcrR family transcriptional regulator